MPIVKLSPNKLIKSFNDLVENYNKHLILEDGETCKVGFLLTFMRGVPKGYVTLECKINSIIDSVYLMKITSDLCDSLFNYSLYNKFITEPNLNFRFDAFKSICFFFSLSNGDYTKDIEFLVLENHRSERLFLQLGRTDKFSATVGVEDGFFFLYIVLTTLICFGNSLTVVSNDWTPSEITNVDELSFMNETWLLEDHVAIFQYAVSKDIVDLFEHSVFEYERWIKTASITKYIKEERYESD